MVAIDRNLSPVSPKTVAESAPIFPPQGAGPASRQRADQAARLVHRRDGMGRPPAAEPDDDSLVGTAYRTLQRAEEGLRAKRLTLAAKPQTGKTSEALAMIDRFLGMLDAGKIALLETGDDRAARALHQQIFGEMRQFNRRDK